MLMNMRDLLSVARANRFAVPAYNISSNMLLTGAIEAAQEAEAPVIIAIHPDELAFVGTAFVAMALEMARDATVPVVIHLDHGSSLEQIMGAIRAGFTSVMIDKSMLPLEENIAACREISALAHVVDVSVEGELGTIGELDEEAEAGAEEVVFADPEQVRMFVDATARGYPGRRDRHITRLVSQRHEAGNTPGLAQGDQRQGGDSARAARRVGQSGCGDCAGGRIGHLQDQYLRRHEKRLLLESPRSTEEPHIARTEQHLSRMHRRDEGRLPPEIRPVQDDWKGRVVLSGTNDKPPLKTQAKTPARECAVSERIALGFCNNVDYEIVWNAEVLESLVRHYRIRAHEPDTQLAICSERDLVVSILGFMQSAQGGERFVGGSDILERFAARFEKKVTLGGTSVRAAIAMRKLGYRSALHLITLNDHVRRLIPQDSPYVCSNERDSIYPHLIVQFGAGDSVRAGAVDIRARQSNRLIYHCNADRIAMRIAPEFGDLIVDAQVLLISGFNAMQSRPLLHERLSVVGQLLKRLPADAVVYLEDGGFHDPAFRKLIYGAIGRRLDVHGMNEDELQSHLGRRVDVSDVRQVQEAMRDLQRAVPAAAIVLHTRQWALAHGNGAGRYAAALRSGVTMATARFRHGDDFTRANYDEIASRAPNAAGAEFACSFNAAAGASAVCVPVADVAQENATTIGLGDAFVAGFLPALLV